MKTRIINTENVMRSLVASLIILTSLAGIANGENSRREVAKTAENELVLSFGSLVSNNEYNAKDFVEAEMAIEIERCLNNNSSTNNEVSGPENALQVEAWMNNVKYNADTFVKAEMASEIEARMNSDKLVEK
jgi:hypothetical protein